MIQREFSHYEVKERIGAGGMGEVYRAHDRRLGRDVALKILPASFAAIPERRERFLRESRLAAQLAHPNIATVFEADEVEGQLYFAMELLHGETLQAHVRAGGMARDELLDLAIPLTEGLAEAHRNGVVHRDLKPGNVMVDPHGRLKIFDFGLSRQQSEQNHGTDDLTQSHQILGTPQYMSPEQVRGETADARSDLFSLGAMLYELATGTKPFEGRSAGEVMGAVLRADPPPMQRANQRLDDGLVRLVGRLLEKEPGERIQTADELLVQLRALRSRTGRAAPQWRRSAVATSAALLAAALGAFLYSISPPAGDRATALTKMVVLPFTNLGPPSEEYYSDGITDAIAARLAGIRGLAVVSRQSAMQYKSSVKSATQIADELGVGYILEGSLQRERTGDPSSRVRLILQLVRAADDTRLWDQTFDVVMTEVFRVQSEIAEKVAQALDIKLLGPEREALARAPTTNLEAYDAYLRGNELRAAGWAEDTLRSAVEAYERAVDLDDTFALAHAQLSRCHVDLYFNRYDITEERLAEARAAAERARALAPEEPAVLLALGQYFYAGHLDYRQALEQYELARRATPGDSELLAYIAFVYRRQGKLRDAIEELETARALDRRNLEVVHNLGSAYSLRPDQAGGANCYSRAAAFYDEAIALRPDWPKVYAHKAMMLLFGEGQPDRARSVLDDASRVVRDTTDDLLALTSIRVAIWTGDWARALREIDAVKKDAIEMQSFVPVASLRAEVHELMGDARAAMADHEVARQVAEGRLATRRDDANVLSALGIALAGVGLEEDAIRAGKRACELMPIRKDAWVGSLRETDLAHIHVKVGDLDVAIETIEHLLSIPGETGPASLRVDPRWIPLRQMPRFEALSRR